MCRAEPAEARATSEGWRARQDSCPLAVSRRHTGECLGRAVRARQDRNRWRRASRVAALPEVGRTP